MKTAFLFFSALASVFLLEGCNFAPPYHPPTAQTPAGFKETNGWKLAEPSDALIKGKWWEVFKDAQLNRLEEKVAISNQNIAAALQNFFSARAIVKQARSAYYPTASVDPSVTETRLSRNGSTSVVTPTTGTATTTTDNSRNRTYTTFSLPVDASWEPDLWGAVRNTVRADAYAAQASASTLENMKLSAQAELAVDYYQLRGQDELIQVYTQTVQAYQQSVNLTKTLFETGIDSELDEAQADALLQTVQVQASALAIQRAQYEHAIAVLIGESPSLFSLPPAAEPVGTPIVPWGVPSTLLERRPDIASAERTVAAANAQIGVARSAYFPTLSISGSGGYQSTSISDLLSPPSLFWSVGATLSETVLDFGRRKAVNEQAWSAYRSTVATYRQTVLNAFQQVEDNLAALRILSTETQQQGVAVKASQRSLDLSNDRFKLGVASYLNVITAQETLLGNQQTVVNLRTQQLTASVQLIMALGGGWTTNDLPSSHKLALKSTDGK